MNIMQMLNNPMAYLGQRFSIPSNLNNPSDIIQHLMNTGQISQQRYNQVIVQAKQMGLIK